MAMTSVTPFVSGQGQEKAETVGVGGGGGRETVTNNYSKSCSIGRFNYAPGS